MLIFFCLATILIFPSAIGSPQTLPDDDYNPNPDTDNEEYDEENEDTKWKQPVESKIKSISDNFFELCLLFLPSFEIVGKIENRFSFR